MEGKPKCKKCGRLLKSSASIARGMGPKCAADYGGIRNAKVRFGKRRGSAYTSRASKDIQITFTTGDTAPQRISTRELAKRRQEKRRRLFDERKPFHCGLLLPERKALIYIPTGDDAWKENNSGRVISHDQLQSYLKRYQLI